MGTEPVSAGSGWAGKNVTPPPKTRPAHRLTGVHKRGAHYSSRRGPRCGRAGSLFEHPVGASDPASVTRLRIFRVRKLFFKWPARLKIGAFHLWCQATCPAAVPPEMYCATSCLVNRPSQTTRDERRFTNDERTMISGREGIGLGGVVFEHCPPPCETRRGGIRSHR